MRWVDEIYHNLQGLDYIPGGLPDFFHQQYVIPQTAEMTIIWLFKVPFWELTCIPPGEKENQRVKSAGWLGDMLQLVVKRYDIPRDIPRQ